MNHERSNKLRAAIETAVYRAIFDDTSFTIDLPKLTLELWERVSIRTPDNMNENERLEFLGDSLMDASIAIALYKIVPEGTPHKYTVILSVLHANRTFCHLARKMKIDYGGADTKNIGDVFETIVGAYYTEKGFEAVHAWAIRIYEPLVREASIAFDECQRKLDRNCAEDLPAPLGKGKARARGQSSAAQHKRTTSRSSARERSLAEGPAASDSRPVAQSVGERTTAETLNHAQTSSTGHDTPSGWHDNDETGQHAFSPYLPPDGSDDEPLPDFWEKVPLPDGKVLFVDHRTHITTWKDPRRVQTPSPPPLREVPAAWRARPTAGSDLDDEGSRTGPLGSDVVAFPDLVREGYTAGFIPPENLSSDALPEFWELRQGLDGKTYYIDHIDATFIPASS
ncbi:uncharacterized protein PHACADRAFT_204280 [Phanerochaete carnosa HHB-10118-sp]|uniref:WW domain-containing protein n=1 Tax=Phanerochaete carnosa (strain HHB-10118-sp) TaxID=650164 RepID=K5XDL8_PHACS|nr:uncharacterized protein PHACADRAFT_204280 [Phanerochaete carnosa HHB-10118-sp]EKM61127.1 hypothetical protein PHACADRAFT_204280 [Phanerochaete carnosa HHB-10118-sp]